MPSASIAFFFSSTPEGAKGNLSKDSNEILAFPFGFTAKADASGVDLKVRDAQDDIVLSVNNLDSSICGPHRR